MHRIYRFPIGKAVEQSIPNHVNPATEVLSAGWKMKCRTPSNSACWLSSLAAPSNMAVWPS